MFTDITGASNFTLEGTATDLTHVNSDFFGVRCDYTATRSAGFIFDDFKIAALTPDVKPPTLLSAKALDEFNIEVVFSESLNQTSAETIAIVSGLFRNSKLAYTGFWNFPILAKNEIVVSHLASRS